MSTKSKLLAKTGDLQLPSDDLAAEATPRVERMPAPPAVDVLQAASGTSPSQFPAVVPAVTPRTGPGQMLQFRGQMLAVEGELTKLRERLKEHEGSLPTRKLDPTLVKPSQWANRHPDAFLNAKFVRLKEDIAAAGGNVQPILVRPIAGETDRFEIVFGHRRHRACLDLGLPVVATIEPAHLSELELFSVMDRENRERADLSPYEQGLMYRRALDGGLYPSNRRLAEALGVSHTWVANVLQVADLPAPIVECFRTPLEIQHRHAKLIGTALEQDRKSVLRRAEKLHSAPKLAASAVVAALTKAGKANIADPQTINVKGREVGTWQRDSSGRLTIRLTPEAIPEERVEALLSKLADALS